MNLLLKIFWPTCLTDPEVAEILTPLPASHGWKCGAVGCDDVTVWLQAKPGPTSEPGSAAISIYHWEVSTYTETLYEMRKNRQRTFWMRETAPLEHDCNKDPGPCVFDKTVDKRSCCLTTFLVQEPVGTPQYGAVFPCNRRTGCHTDVTEPIHGSIIWTAPKGWLVRVGADFWIDREDHVLGGSINGEWVESTTPFSHFSW